MLYYKMYTSNICFMCFKNIQHLRAVYLNKEEDCTVKQIKYVLPEIMLESKIPSPAYICSTCHIELNSFYTFKKLCLENYCRLKQYTDQNQYSEDHNLLLTNIKNESDCEQDCFSHFMSEDASISDGNKSHEYENQENNEIQKDIEFVNCEEPKLISDIKKENDDGEDCFSYLISEESKEVNQNETNDLPDHSSNQIVESDIKDEMKGYECKICNKKFKEKKYLPIHMKIHKGIKDFECSICNKKFSQKINLEVHMKLHSGIKDLQCTICDKMFSHRSNMNKHIKLHSGVKNFQCSSCDKKFSRKGQLSEHMKRHAGIKNFECYICKRKFILKSDLNEHIKLHTATKDFQCDTCDKKYSRKHRLKQHMKTCGVETA